MRLVALVLILGTLIGCTTLKYAPQWGEPNYQANVISPTELIVIGERFDGWLVRVIGIVRIDKGVAYLFHNRDSYEIGDFSASIMLGLASEIELLGISPEELREAEGDFILVEGRFKNRPRFELEEGEMLVGANSAGSLSQINMLIRLGRPR